jgi:hypothetical protein
MQCSHCQTATNLVCQRCRRHYCSRACQQETHAELGSECSLPSVEVEPIGASIFNPSYVGVLGKDNAFNNTLARLLLRLYVETAGSKTTSAALEMGTRLLNATNINLGKRRSREVTYLATFIGDGPEAWQKILLLDATEYMEAVQRQPYDRKTIDAYLSDLVVLASTYLLNLGSKDYKKTIEQSRAFVAALHKSSYGPYLRAIKNAVRAMV